MLSIQGNLDFFFDPCTVHGMFRYDEQELILFVNGLVDDVSQCVSCLEVVWRKPTRNALLLKVSVKLLSNVFVLRCITQYTRMIESDGRRCSYHRRSRSRWQRWLVSRCHMRSVFRCAPGLPCSESNAKYGQDSKGRPGIVEIRV